MTNNVVAFPERVVQDDCPRRDQIAKHEEAIANLKAWQDKQNGTLQRLENKVDRLLLALVGGVFAIVAGLAVLIMKQ